MRTTSIAPLLAAAGAGGSDIGMHQGVVIEWDDFNGTNRINVAGNELANLPVLTLGDFVAIQANDVVMILRVKHSYFILGRVVPPASPDRNRATVDFAGVGVTNSGFGIPTTLTDRVTGSFDVPSWADEAMVLIVVTVAGVNSTAGNASLQARAVIDGAGGGTNTSSVGPGGIVTVPATAQRLVTNPGSTISVAAQGLAGAPTAFDAHANNHAHIDGYAIFRRID